MVAQKHWETEVGGSPGQPGLCSKTLFQNKMWQKSNKKRKQDTDREGHERTQGEVSHLPTKTKGL